MLENLINQRGKYTSKSIQEKKQNKSGQVSVQS